MKVAGFILMALGALLGLIAFGTETTSYVSGVGPFSAGGEVGNLPAQHKQLVMALGAGFLFLSGTVLVSSGIVAEMLASIRQDQRDIGRSASRQARDGSSEERHYKAIFPEGRTPVE